MNITPDYYTTTSGGIWLPWTFGELKNVPPIYNTHEPTASFRSVLDAPKDYRKGQEPCVAKEFMIELHSFAVGNPMDTSRGGYARWDSYNGWTTSPEDVADMDKGR